MLGAADDEVVGRFSPVLLQPGNVRFESARGNDDRLRVELMSCPIANRYRRDELSITYLELANL